MESGLPDVVKERSIKVFTELGEAEAKTHGSTLAQVEPIACCFRAIKSLDLCDPLYMGVCGYIYCATPIDFRSIATQMASRFISTRWGRLTASSTP